MALYNHLAVYKASYDLLVDLFRFVKEFNREYKYTIGESMKKEALEMIRGIYRANGSLDKIPWISQARENVEVIRLYLRLTRDLKQITLEQFVRLNARIEMVSSQLTGWQKYCSRDKMASAGVASVTAVASEPFSVQSSSGGASFNALQV